MSRLLRRLILVAVAWDMVQVLMLIGFTPPLEPGLRSLQVPLPSILTLYTYQSLFLHALALPFLAALTYIVLLKFEVKQTTRSYIIYNMTAGFMLTSIGGMGTVFFRWSPITHGIFFVGLVLGFAAGVALLLGLWPRRSLSNESTPRLRGFDLPQLILWLCILSILSTTVMGSYAATGSEDWGATGSIPQFGLVKATHEHVIITIIDVAIVVLVAEHYGVRGFTGVRRIFGKIGYYACLIGVPLVTLTTYATIPYGVEAHNAITPFATLLLQGALFFMYAIFADFVVKQKAKSWVRAFLRGVFGDPVAFGLLFVFLWVNVAVTLPGIYVAVNLNLFRGLPNETPFILGHEHALITLTAVALLLFAVELFRIQGWTRRLIGTTTTLGYIISTGAAVPYVFLDPNPYTGAYMPYIQLGLVLMLLGTGAAVAAMAASLRKGLSP